MDALIFDFDGVIVDSEPLHLKCFQEVLSTLGISLSAQEYYSQYLGFDDHDCFAAVLRRNGRAAGEEDLRQLTADKTARVQREYGRSIQAMPGAVALARQARGQNIPVAVCSGALGAEIDLAARTVGVRDQFLTIVSAQDVSRGKPDPEGYRLALDRLSDLAGRPLTPERTVAVEDSPAGIEAAKAAGLKALAVTNSYPAAALQQADAIVDSLAKVNVDFLNRLAG